MTDQIPYFQPAPKHTPGPWTAFESGSALYVGAGTNCTVAHIYVPPVGGQMVNARLIAAAPELLAVLQEIVDADDEAVKALEELGCVDPECVKLTNKARTAIAKATGAQA